MKKIKWFNNDIIIHSASGLRAFGIINNKRKKTTKKKNNKRKRIVICGIVLENV